MKEQNDMVYDEKRGELVATRDLEKGELATVSLDDLKSAFGWDGIFRADGGS